MERQFLVAFIDMEHDWKKATLKPAVAAKKVMRHIWRAILKGIPFFGRRNDTLKQFFC